MFYYHSGTDRHTYDNTDFRPVFSDELLGSLTLLERTQYAPTCNKSNACLFDLALTSTWRFNVFYDFR